MRTPSPALRAELLDRLESDQRKREAFFARGRRDWAPVERVDEDNETIAAAWTAAELNIISSSDQDEADTSRDNA